VEIGFRNVGTDNRKLSSTKLLIQAGHFFKCTPSFFSMQLKIHTFIPFQICACSESIYSQCQFVGIHMSRQWEPRVIMWLLLVLWANGTLSAVSEAGLGFSFHSFTFSERMWESACAQRKNKVIKHQLFALTRKHYCLEADKCQAKASILRLIHICTRWFC